MAEWVLKNKTFNLISNGEETGVKVDLRIDYRLTNGLDEQTVYEEIEDILTTPVTGAALTTRELAVLLAANA